MQFNLKPSALFAAIIVIGLSGLASAADVAVNLSATTLQRGETLEVSVSGLPGNPHDWLTLVKADAAETKFGEWTYTDGATKGTWTFTAPRPGSYEVRVYFNYPDGGYTVQARASLEVVAKQVAEKPATATPLQQTNTDSAATPAVEPQSTAAGSPGMPFGRAKFAQTLTDLLGKPVSTADNVIQGLGFSLFSKAGNCEYNEASGMAARRVTVVGSSRPCLTAGSLVTEIHASETLVGETVFPESEIEVLKAEIGSKAECSEVTASRGHCSWERPKAMPLAISFNATLASIGGAGGINSRQYSLTAATDAASAGAGNVADSTTKVDPSAAATADHNSEPPVSSLQTQGNGALETAEMSPAEYFYGEIDALLSDENFVSGIPAAQINSFLELRGYERQKRKTEFIFIIKHDRTFVSVQYSCSGVEQCRDPNGIVETIFVFGGGIPSAEAPPNMYSIFAKHFGLQPKCSTANGTGPEVSFGKTVAITCNWNLSTSRHSFQSIRLAGMESGFQLTLFGG